MADLARSAESAYTLYREGKLTEAEALLDRILGKDATDVAARLLRGVIRVKRGALEAASSDLEGVLAADPTNYEGLTWLALVRKNQTRYDEAITLLEKAISLDRAKGTAYNTLGMCYLSMRNIQLAIGAFQSAVEIEPRSGGAHLNLGLAYRLAEKRRLALNAFKKAASYAPENPTNFSILAEQCARMGLWDQAIQALEEGRKKHPENLPLLLALAAAYGEVHDADRAEELFQEGVSLDPNAIQAYALWLQDLGRFEEAIKMLQDSVRAHPRQGLAYMALAEARKYRLEDGPLGDKVAELLEEQHIPPTPRMYLQYALARSREHEQRYEEAMMAFNEANNLAFHIYNRGRPFDFAIGRSLTDRTIDLYGQEEFARVRDAGSPSQKPILIVGMIRSGTTLLDQILSSHPLVESAGETVFWMEESDSLYSRWQQGVKPEDLKDIAARYESLLDETADGSPFVTDKMPLNFLHIGHIHATFPKAKILHIRRNPIDTCLSIYATHFGSGPNFAYKKENIVFFYQEYMRLMEHWRRVLPEGALFELDYEALVENRDRTVRDVLQFCGLPWDEACLRHEHNAGQINSPSRWQARQPIYKTSVDRWKHYEPWLGAFADLKTVAHPPAHHSSLRISLMSECNPEPDIAKTYRRREAPASSELPAPSLEGGLGWVNSNGDLVRSPQAFGGDSQ